MLTNLTAFDWFWFPLAIIGAASACYVVAMVIEGVIHYARIGRARIAVKDPTVFTDAERLRRMQALHEMQIVHREQMRDRDTVVPWKGRVS